MRVLTAGSASAEVRDTQVRETTTPPGGGSADPPPGNSAASPPRRRTGSGTLLLPPWTRAPLLAFGEPAVIFAVLAATIILACASSSAALFLSSAASESLHRTLAADCPNAGYPAIQLGPITSVGEDRQDILQPPFGVVEAARNVPDLAALDRKARSALVAAGFSAPYHIAVADTLGRLGPPPKGADPHATILMYRDGALANIEAISRGPTRGLWVPQTLAIKLNLRAGQQVPLTFNSGYTTDTLPPATVPVAGIYQDLWQKPTTAYWCSYTNFIQNATSATFPPSLVLATDAATFDQVQRVTGVTAAHFWAAPIATDQLTLTGARDVVARQADAYRRFGYPAPADLAARNSGAGQMPQFAQQTTLVRNGLRGPVVPIALGGTILALLLVGAAGSYWADRRSREVRLLSSRGVSPAALATKAVLELFLPAVIGTLIGWQVARWLVQALGPNPHLDHSAPGQALLTAGLALAAGLALLALVAGQRSRAATERPIGAKRTWLAIVPWELALLAGSLGCYLRLRSGEAVVLDRNVAQINLLVVAFPLLFLVGAAVLAVRLLVLLLMWITRRAGRRWSAWYLAGRRITAARLASVTLLAAASTPIAMLVYAAGLTQTSQHTLEAKAQLLVGSAVSVRTNDPLVTTPETAKVGTVVTRYLYGRTGGQDVAVLSIDPDTFDATAFWDSSFASRSLASLLDQIRRPGPGGRVAAIVVPGSGNAALPPSYDVQLGKSTAHIATVATAHLFPGRRLPDPMIVVSTPRLGTIDPHAGSTNELWSRGSIADAETALKAQHARIFDTVEQGTVFEAANFLGISWTFGYLSALAALVGLVAIGGLLLYLETRQRSRVAAYALGRRMGLTRATHLRSLLAELGVLLATAFVVGAGLAWAAVLLVYSRLDVDKIRPPAPLLTVPSTALVGGGVAVLVVACLAALYAQRAADRGNVSEVLRLGG
jgi:putative ABC transport system permease protein